MTACWVLASVLLIGQAAQGPPPLSQEQQAKIQELVRDTQKRGDDLKSKLEQRQRELAKIYGEFTLDETVVARLQNDILDLQKQLLTSYHTMQVELRGIVGPERFAVLRQRIDNLLGTTPPTKRK